MKAGEKLATPLKSFDCIYLETVILRKSIMKAVKKCCKKMKTYSPDSKVTIKLK